MDPEILIIQNTFFKAMAERATLALSSQHTISKRKLLNFIIDVKDFCDHFVNLNDVTLKAMEPPTCQIEEDKDTTLSLPMSLEQSSNA